ncbi:MAG: hypothetical protein Q9167_007331 [Letrouitia subvulpina]
MKTSTSFLIRNCLVLFNQIIEKIEQSDYNNLHGKEVPAVSWIDELGRLRIWAANIGAHQTGQSSLDFRLRDASHISDEITDLLNDLSGRLDEIAVLLSDDTNSDTHLETDLTANFLDEPSLTEIQQLYEEVVTIVKCLYQMSMLIRNPARHNLLAESVPDDVLMSDRWDRQHVSNKFPQADDTVIEHLGRGITRRRRYLKYRERHSAKLSRGLEHDLDTEAQTMSSTMATGYKADIIDSEDTASNSGISQTSYAPSLYEGGNVTIPPLPKESLAGKPFICPYCYFVVDVQNTRSWTRHIFKDLKPYSCTFSDCRTIDRLYISRTEWFFHVSNTHDVSNLQCPLCKDSLMSLKFFERHVARHLEELALFVLPRTEPDAGEEHDDEAQSIDSESNYDSATESSHHESIKGEATVDEGSDFVIPPLRRFETSPHRLTRALSESELRASEALKIRSILKKPEHESLEDPSFIQESVTLPQGIDMKGIPPNARWTKIDRKLVNPEALDEKGEHYEVREDYVVVLRVLTKEEIEILVDRTQMIRSTRGRLEVDNDKEAENELSAENLKKLDSSQGHSEESIENTFEKVEKKKHHHHANSYSSNEASPVTTTETFVKVHRKHCGPETLDTYNLPWEWENV